MTIGEQATKYKRILVTQRGGLEALKIAENELRPPEGGEVCIKILTSPVFQDDVAVRVVIAQKSAKFGSAIALGK